MPLTRQEIAKRYYERHKEECLQRGRDLRNRKKGQPTDKCRATKRAWYAKNRERILVSRNPEKARMAARKYRETHREEVLLKRREYMRSLPKEVKRQRNARYRETNRAKLNARARDAYKKRPERRLAVKQLSIIRKAIVRGASVTEGPIDRMGIFTRDRGVCHICSLLADQDDFHLDHVIPLARGGPHTMANVAVAHPRCNQKKGAKIGWKANGLVVMEPGLGETNASLPRSLTTVVDLS